MMLTREEQELKQLNTCNGQVDTEMSDNEGKHQEIEPVDTFIRENGKEFKVDVMEVDNNVKSPVTWDNELQFILTCVGYAVGLSNIWRFPYLCLQNGGAVFLIPYFISLVMCGMPLFFLEVCLGQFSGLSPLDVWKMCPLFKGLGYSMLVISGVICIYYNVIIAWVLFYLFKSMTNNLPWSTCSNSWNTPLCLDDIEPRWMNESEIHNDPKWMNESEIHNDPKWLNKSENYSSSVNVSEYGNAGDLQNITIGWISAAKEYWKHEVLKISTDIGDIGGIRWELVGCLLLTWVIIYLCLFQGVKSIGKVVYVTATSPYILLTILLMRGVTLPGAINGIKYYIVPNWGKLLDAKVWAVALMQVIYSLGPGWGTIIVMSSYNKFNNNCLRDGILIPLINGCTSFYGGFVIFSVLGFMSHTTGKSVEHYVTSGPGLAFIAYPEALAKLPLSPLWAILFFLMLLTVGIDTQFGTFEAVSSSLMSFCPRKANKHKWLYILLLCVAEATVGIICVTDAGFYFFQIMDYYAAAFSVLIIAFFECIVVAWIYGHNQLYRDIEMMLGTRPSIFWKLCWCFINPCMLLICFCYSVLVMKEPTYGDYHYPNWAIVFGWALAMMSIIPLPIMFVKAVLQQKGSISQRIILASRPDPTWGPSCRKYKSIYKYNRTFGLTFRPCKNSVKKKAEQNGINIYNGEDTDIS